MSVVVSIVSVLIALGSLYIARRALEEAKKNNQATIDIQTEQTRLQKEQTNLSSILAKYEIQERSERRVSKQRADVRVYFVHVGNKSKVFVVNRGEGEAKNITFSLRDQNGVDPVVESKTTPMPIKSILPNAHVEFLASYTMASLPPWKCKIEWVDEDGEQSRDNEVTAQSSF